MPTPKSTLSSLFLAILSLLVAAIGIQAQDPFEIQVYEYETVPKGMWNLECAEFKLEAASNLRAAADEYEAATRLAMLERIPVRQKDAIVIIPIEEIASIVAEGEVLHITTIQNENYTIIYRLKDLEARLEPARFVRLGRGALANVRLIRRVNALPGGTYLVTLSTGQQLKVSRIQSRVLREQLLRL